MKRLSLSPFLIALAAGLAVVVVAFAPALWQLLRGTAPAPVAASDSPWQVQRSGGGTAVFGLALPGATIGDAQARWGEGLALAVMAESGQPGALEGYVERFDGGGISGRLLLATELPAPTLAQLQRDAVERKPAGGEVWRYTLRADEQRALASAPVVGLSFIPAVNLEPATLRERFGAPDEVVATGGRLEHWLYPARGLAIVVDAEGRELMQYVAPADFERRLRAPLAAGITPADSPAASAPR